jgi:hypothetical protein
MFSCRGREFCPSCHAKRIADIFSREGPAMLVRKELLSPEWVERLFFHSENERRPGEGLSGEAADRVYRGA